jgi:hypothetical protein
MRARLKETCVFPVSLCLHTGFWLAAGRPGGADPPNALFLQPFVRWHRVQDCPARASARPIAHEPRRRLRLPPPHGPHPRSGPRRRAPLAVFRRPGDEGGGQGRWRSADACPVERREAARGFGREGKVFADRPGSGNRDRRIRMMASTALVSSANSDRAYSRPADVR